MNYSGGWRAWATIPWVAVVSGCVGVTQHHVQPDDRPNPGNSDLVAALGYADSAKDEYKQALINQDRFQTTLGAMLIPLGAATLGLGIAGAGQTSITVLGLTGATAYGVGTWLQRRPTQLAYIAGYNAVNCAVEAVIPLSVQLERPQAVATQDGQQQRAPQDGQSQDGVPRGWHFDRFNEDLRSIDGQITQVEVQIAVVQGDIARKLVTDDAVAQKEIEIAERVIANAVAARRSGISLLLEIDSAGPNLVTAVDRIASEVDKAIVTSQPDLVTLSSIVGGLGQAYGRFTTVPEGLRVARPPEERVTPQDTGDSSVRQLREDSARLSATSRSIGDFVNAVAASKPTERLRACGVEPDQLASDISIEPPGPIQFTAGQAATKGVVVLGGQSPYTGQILGTPAGLFLRQAEPFGPAFAVEATQDSREGTHPLHLRDGGGRQRVVEIVVAAATPQRAVATDAQPTPSETVFNTYSLDDRKKIERGICLDQDDGVWSSATRNALMDYLDKTGRSQDTRLSSEIVDEILAPSEDGIIARCNLLSLHDNLSDASYDVMHDSQADGEVVILYREVDGRQIKINVMARVEKEPEISEILPDEIASKIVRNNEGLVTDIRNIKVGIINPESAKPRSAPQ